MPRSPSAPSTGGPHGNLAWGRRGGDRPSTTPGSGRLLG
ncbi:unnamed protein product [Ixodes hexagonus]